MNIKSFDFDAVLELMTKSKWKWWTTTGYRIPNKTDLISTANYLVEQSSTLKVGGRISTGGFTVIVTSDGPILMFGEYEMLISC